MKPRTKLQREVLSLSEGLSDITNKHYEWSKHNLFEKKAWLKKKTQFMCNICGCLWHAENTLEAQLLGCNCPSCGESLKVELTRKRKFDDVGCFTMCTAYQGYQVIRNVIVNKRLREGESVSFDLTEVSQLWLDLEKLKVVVIGRRKQMCRHFFMLGSKMEIRGTFEFYDMSSFGAYVFPGEDYPNNSFLPILRQRGLEDSTFNCCQFTLIKRLLIYSETETLLKAKMYKLLVEMCRWDGAMTISLVWKSIKICLRNNYEPYDATIWIDYIRMLEEEGKDIRNAYYVCPKDLHDAHQRLLAKKRKREEERMKARKLEEQLRNEEAKKAFVERVSKYVNVSFKDKDLDITVLPTVEAFKAEGDTLHHCVFQNAYYKKLHSLIMSARIGNKPIETIEIDLKDFSIIQCRGLHNQSSPHHDRIVKLVKDNMYKIKSAKGGTKEVYEKAS